MAQIDPSLDDFTRTHDAGHGQAVWTTHVADLETPVSTYLKLADGRDNSFLFESVTGGEVRGRYSIIGMKPDIVWRCDGQTSQINRAARYDPGAFEACEDNPLSALRALVAETRMEIPHGLPPMVVGLFGYMGYDTIRLVEHLPDVNADMLQVPDAVMMRPTIVVVFDAIKDLVTIVTPVWPEAGVSARAAYARAAERLSDTVSDFERPLPQSALSTMDHAPLETPTSNIDKADYLEIVDKAKEYILAGDIFQVVPSQRFSTPFHLPPIALYRALRRTNPSPYMYYLDMGGFSIVGSSPEILVRVADGKVTVRPIAGTRPRGETPEHDRELEEDLLADPKELAEHLMLLDLGRNDVGRVARIGAVRVTEEFVIERYSHVMHIVSNVEGDIRDDVDAIDALLAGLPAGTVSGAPKVRAMEIIDELEPHKRSIYGGGIGYISANGSMDTCLVLRTAVVKDGVMHVQAGGGVVADSEPETEFEETVNKSRALMRAAEEAVRFAGLPGKSQ